MLTSLTDVCALQRTGMYTKVRRQHEGTVFGVICAARTNTHTNTICGIYDVYTHTQHNTIITYNGWRAPRDTPQGKINSSLPRLRVHVTVYGGIARGEKGRKGAEKTWRAFASRGLVYETRQNDRYIIQCMGCGVAAEDTF